MKALLGKKLGMSRMFEEDGTAIPVTLIQTGPNVIVQIKTKENDGYNAVQLGFGSRKENRTTKPLQGHFKKANVSLQHYLREVRVDSVEGLELGQAIGVEIFKEGEKVHVTSISKGLGTQGTIRRHGFARGLVTHGQSNKLRSPGSIGSASYPARVFKGMKMAGHMGNVKTTVQNLKVCMVDTENNVIALRGAVPGKNNVLVKIRKK